MSTDRVVAFETGQTAAPRPAPRAVIQQANATMPPPAAPASADVRAMSRAKLASTWAALMGEAIPAADLLERLRKTGSAEGSVPGLAEIARGLSASGLRAQPRSCEVLTADLLPTLAEMTNGQVVLVLSMGARGPEVYDPTARDHRAEVPMQDFQRVFAGRILRAELTMADLAARHTDDGTRKHWFWSEFARFRRPFAEISAASLVANLLAVAVSLFSMQVYDRVIPYQSEATLWVLALGVLLAVGLEGVLKISRASLMDGTGKKMELAVQNRLMDRLLGMKMGPGERRPSEVFSAMRDFASVREFFTASTVGTLADLPFLLVFLALVASIGGNLVWVLIIGGILMVLPGFLMQKRMVAMAAATQGAAIKSSKLLYETVFEHETVTTQRGEDRVRRIWSELVAVNAVTGSSQRHLLSMLSTWSAGVQQATYIAAVVMGTYMVFAGHFTVGTIIAIGLLTGRTLGPLNQLSSMMARWSQVKQALTALEAVANSRQIEDPERSYLRRDRLRGEFELHGLEFRYDEKAPASVEIPGIAIPAGQRIAVLGANGSGKSTLLRLLAGLYEPSKGRVMIDGVDLGQVHPRDLRRNIGYLGQEVRLIAGTLRDNLNLNQLERDDERMLSALDFAGLGPFVRNHPRGLDLELREMGEGLSVGQRQSIGWARLWLQDPQIVLLDEPTAALDQTLEATLVSRLKTWLEGRTAVIATHRVPILALTTRTVIMQNGRLAVDGPKDAVLAHLAQAQAQNAAQAAGGGA